MRLRRTGLFASPRFLWQWLLPLPEAEIRPQVLYNPAMRSPNFFVPGVIGIVLQLATRSGMGAALVALCALRFRQKIA